MRARLVTPAAESLSFELTIAIVKDARSGLSMYAKKERIISSEAAIAKVGAKGRTRKMIDAGQERHFGYEDIRRFGYVLLDCARLVLLPDGTVNEEQYDAEKDRQDEQGFV